MVKPDVQRDYYADLGLTPSADLEDIKKQYKKLGMAKDCNHWLCLNAFCVNEISALKYHPDRNPGRELEFNAKFQAIQAAHEILSDDQQRKRYDIDRLRAGYGKHYSPPKPDTPQKKPANPYPSAYPPKAQTFRQPFSGRPQSSYNGHSTGTQSYANYARAGARPPWEKTYDAGQTRTDAYRRFQGTWGTSTTGFRFGQRTGRAGYTSVPRPNATPAGQPTRPKSAYDYFKTTTNQSSRTQSTRKKHGFAPRSASGDEPMAANTSSYTTVPRRERFQASDDLPGEAAPTATTENPAAPSGYGAENTGTPNSKQKRSTNASTDGDRTFFSASGLHSDGVCNPPKKSSAQSQTPPIGRTSLGSGRKSAGPRSHSDGGQKGNSTNSSDTDDDYLARRTRTVPQSGPQNLKSSNLNSQTGSAPRNGKPPSPRPASTR
jgi:curved DNA-binding protein CbpA